MKKNLLLWFFTLSFVIVEAQNIDFALTKFECADSVVTPGDLVEITIGEMVTCDDEYWNLSEIQICLSEDTIIDENDIELFYPEGFTFYHDVIGEVEEMNISLEIPNPYDNEREQYYLIAKSDYLDVYEETNETNNTRYSPIKLTTASDVDFYLQNVMVHSDTLVQFQGFNVSFESYFSGSCDYPLNSFYKFMFSKDTIWGNTPDDLLMFGNLKKGVWLNTYVPMKGVSQDLMISDQYEGTLYLLVCTDWLDFHKEVNEDNNVAAIELYVRSAEIDFVYDELSCSQQVLQSGQIVNVVSKSWYEGNVSGGQFADLQIFLSEDTLIDSSDLPILVHGSIDNIFYEKKGNIEISSTEIQIPEQTPAGQYYIVASISDLHSSAEVNISNNIQYCSVEISDPPKQDFVAATIQMNETLLYSGGQCDVTCRLNYVGNSMSNVYSPMALYFSIDSLWDETDIRIGRISEAQVFNVNTTSQNFRFYSVTIPDDVEVGIYYLLAKADPQNEIDETDETNNTISKQIKVEHLNQDLIIDLFLAESDSAYNGNYWNFKTEYRYVSESSNNVKFKLGLFLSEDTILNNDKLDALPQTELESWMYLGNRDFASTYSMFVPEDIDPGEYYAIIVLDYDSLLNETNEQSNMAYAKVVVKDPPVHDFILEYASLSKSIVKPSENVFLSFDQVYCGNYTEEMEVYYQIYFTNDTLSESYLSKACYNSCDSYGYSSHNRRVSCSRNMTIPESTLPGTYYFVLVADSENRYDESNETNNKLVVPVEVEAVFCDFSIDSLVVTPYEVPMDDYVTVSVYGRFDGNTLWGKHVSVQIRMSENDQWGDADDYVFCSDGCLNMYLSSDYLTNMGEYTVLIPEKYKKGNYYMMANIDWNDSFDEVDEMNNIVTEKFVVTDPAVREFYVSNVSLLDSIAYPGAEVRISYTHHYAGNSIKYLFSSVGLFISKDTIWDETDREIRYLFDPFDYVGANYVDMVKTRMRSIQLPKNIDLGEYFLILRTDYDNQHIETNETNNTAYVPVSINKEEIDLSVRQITLNRDTVQLGGLYQAVVTCMSTGNSFSDIERDCALYLSSDSVFSADDVLLSSHYFRLDYNERQVSIPFFDNIPYNLMSGSYFFIAKIYNTSNGNEDNEANNTKSIPVLIQPKPLHDFYFSEASVSENILVPGQRFNLQASFCYEGNSIDAVEVPMGVYLSSDSILCKSSDISLKSTQWASFDANRTRQNVSLNFTFPQSVTSGTYYLILYADANEGFTETNEINNTCKIKVDVEDLYYNLSVNSIEISPDSLQLGGGVDVDFRIKLESNTKSEVYVRSVIYLSTDSVWGYDDAFFGQNYSSIFPSDTISHHVVKNVRVELSEYYGTGAYYLFVITDFDNEVDENNEGDNYYASILPVVEPASRDFYVSNVNIQADEFQPGTNISFEFTNEYSGNSNDQLLSATLFSLSVDSVLGNSDDVVLGYKSRLMNNVSNPSANVSELVALPPDLQPGKYYFCISADYNDQHAETDETNNHIMIPIQVDEIVSDFTISDFTLSYDTVQLGGYVSAFCQMNYEGNSINKVSVYQKMVVSADSIIGNADDLFLSPVKRMVHLSKTDTVKSFSEKLTFNTDLEPETYYVIVQADPDNRSIEINEENNIECNVINVIPEAENDFAVSSISFVSDTVQSFGEISNEIVCEYAGNSISDVLANIKYYLSADSVFGNADDSEIYVYPQSSIRFSRNKLSDTTSVNYKFYQELIGDYYFFAKIDHDELYTETNEANNVQSKKIYFEEIVNDLFVNAIHVTPHQIQQEGKFCVEFQACYQGNSSLTHSTNAMVLLSKDTIWDENDDFLLYKSGNSHFSFSENMTLKDQSLIYNQTNNFEVGKYYLLLKIDQANYISEIDEENNIAYCEIEILERASRDFSISDALVYKDKFYLEEDFNISYCMNYQGNSVDDLVCRSKTVLSKNDIWGDADDIQLSPDILTCKLNTSKTSNSMLLSNVDLSKSVQPGAYFLITKIDCDDQHEETDEANNYSMVKIEVLDGEYDAFVTEVKLNADTVYVGGAVELSGLFGFTSKTQSCAYPRLSCYLSSDSIKPDFENEEIFSSYINLTPSGEYHALSLSIPDSIMPGDYFIYVKVHPAENLIEKNLRNNLVRIKTSISDVGVNDFSAENIQIQKDTFFIYEPLDVSFDIVYSGNSKTMLECAYTVKLSTDSLANDYFYLSHGKVRVSSDSSVVQVGKTIKHRPAYVDYPCEVYFTVEVDNFDKFREETEENNIAKRKIAYIDYPVVDLSLSNLKLKNDSICLDVPIGYSLEVNAETKIDYPIEALVEVIISENGVVGDRDDWHFGYHEVVLSPGDTEARIVITEKINPYWLTDPGEYLFVLNLSSVFIQDTIAQNDQITAPFRLFNPAEGDFTVQNVNLSTDTILAGNNIDVEYLLSSINGLYSLNMPDIGACLSKDSIYGNSDDICFFSYLKVNHEIFDFSTTEKKSVFIPEYASGIYYLIIKVDASDRYVENNEDNNVVCTKLYVKPPATNDFYLTDFEVTPDIVDVESGVNFTAKLHNGGDNPNFILPDILWYVSVNEVVGDADDLFSGRLIYNAIIDTLTGDIFFFSEYIPWYLEEGVYKFITVIDDVNYSETDFTNNISISSFHFGCKPSVVHEFIYLCTGEEYEGWSAEGVYERLLTSVGGCDSTVFSHLYYVENPIKPLVCFRNGSLVAPDSFNYQWYNDEGLIDGAADSIYFVTAKGSYAVRVFNEFGCISEISDFIYVDYTGILELDTDLVFYPNPTNGLINFNGIHTDEELKITVIDLSGKRFQRNVLTGGDANLDISSLPDGVYLLKIENRKIPFLKVIKTTK